ncbi:phosphotransferase (plasmid) [Streptomyces sp. NBC_00853]|uniref:phosphotransferase n=1 Tax=Streptomyces sp. NBC_00853 TaxID=2903681 RepID=UPI002F90A785|nr:phosphotransferase [Streptomyces sp. NBC_00853]
MLLPNEVINRSTLVKIIREQYEGANSDLVFQPLGEDSWSYRSGSLWISIRRDLRGHVPAAYETAYRLHQGGNRFVLAPLKGADGRIVRTIDGFPVVVFPWLQSVPVHGGPSLTPEESEQLLGMLERIHTAPQGGLPVENFSLSFESDLVEALDLADQPKRCVGPYSSRLHQLLGKHRKLIDTLRAESRGLASLCRTDPQPFGVTHGEPSSPNVLRHEGQLLLADWGGAMWGPPERDLFHVRRTLGLHPDCRPEFLRFYEVRWILSEITEYSCRFTHTHVGDAEDDAMWMRLLRYLDE